MKRTDGFVLTYVDNVPYVLPYGQNIAEHRRGMKLNETGVFLWNALSEETSREQLLTLFSRQYHALENERPELEKDLNAFLSQLSAWGMLEESPQPSPASDTFHFLIGGLLLRLCAPKEAILDAFLPFLTSEVTDGRAVDLTIQICTVSGSHTCSTGGRVLLHTNELLVCETAETYTLFFPLSKQLREARITKDGQTAQVFCRLPYREPLTTELFHAIRFLFLYRAGQLGLRALHSASIFYRNQAWLFSGSSGTGKSTHTNLWNAVLGTPVINGDVNVISNKDGKPFIHGTPWCGTSGIATPGSFPLGGIVLLQQGKENTCTSLSGDEQALSLMQRMISPSWTPEMVCETIAFAESLVDQILVTKLHCTKEPDAAHYMKSVIDTYLDHKES